MANDLKIQLSATQLATMMTNRVTRERNRIAKMINDHGDSYLSMGKLDFANDLRAIAETVRDGIGGGLTMRPVAFTEDREEEIDEADPELPAIHHNDDFEDGVSLARSLSTFGRSANPNAVRD